MLTVVGLEMLITHTLIRRSTRRPLPSDKVLSSLTQVFDRRGQYILYANGNGSSQRFAFNVYAGYIFSLKYIGKIV